MIDKNPLIVIPDDHYHRKNNPTFLVYAYNGELLHKSPYNLELDCKELVGQGRPTFRPFGVTSDSEYLYVASNKKIGKYNKHSFDYCGSVDIPMYNNTHQILKSGKDFYVAHTAVNAIGCHGKTDLFFDVASLRLVDAPVSPIDVDIADLNHINSILEHDGKIYFCLNNFGQVPSQFGYFDKITYESKIIASAGSRCHDLEILDNKLYSLSSGTGEIIEIDLANGSSFAYQIVDSNKTFLRGMDASEDTLIFAASNRYSTDTVYMNNCFISGFDTGTKSIKRQFFIRHADIVNSIKIVR